MGFFEKLFGKTSTPAAALGPNAQRVLVADTSITIAKVIELTLSDAEVTIVSSIEQAMASLKAQRPEVVIASVQLADGDGYELARAIAGDPFHSCPVILLHSTFEPFDEAKARNAGASAVLKKPFEPSELLRTVQRVLAERQ